MATAEKYVVVLGSLNMDLVMETSRIPAPGETMHGKEFHTSPGGKGLNQAVAAARLLQDTGVKTYMVGRVGDDEFCERLTASLETEGIDISHVKQVKGKPSGVALIIVPPPPTSPAFFLGHF
jgi:ribokinase